MIPDRLAAALADRYHLTRELGAGGMATVYLADDVKHGRQVAIKVLRPEIAAALGPDRFIREIEIASRLNHPHVLPLFDSGRIEVAPAGAAPGRGPSVVLYYVMPYVEGESLRQRLTRDRALPLEDAVRLTEQVASALTYAHERGIVHRDIKPENILLAGDQAVVADFGIAKAIEEAGGNRLTETGLAIGTPAYMSPEQALGHSAVDARSDVYALGCVLYEMVAGRPPFIGAVPQALVAQHAVDPPPSLQETGARVPAAVDQAVARALAKDPEARFQTPRGLADALQSATSAQQSGGAGATAVRRRAGWAAAIVAAGGLAVGAWYVAVANRAPPITDRSVAVLPFETIGQEQASPFTDGVHGDLLTRLSSLSDLRVTSRTSVMRYRNPAQDLSAIARDLGVTWIVRGEVQETPEAVQVSARLVNAQTDRQVWADSYRRELTAANLFDIQAEITRQIALALETQLSPAEERQVARRPTEDLQAHQLYAQGRAQLDRRTLRGMETAETYFRRAIARDSTFALAWAGLADAFSLRAYYNYADPDSALPAAWAAAQRAFRLDSTVADVRASRGIVHSLRRNGPAAIDELERSVEFNPSYAEAYSWLGWVELLLGAAGRAVESLRRAVELNPFAPAYRAFLADGLLATGQAAEALRAAERAREIQPEYGLAYFLEGLALYHLGRLALADSTLQRALRLVPPEGSPSQTEVQAALAVVAVVQGDAAAARDRLAGVRARGDPFAAGLVLAALGDREAAFEAFSRVTAWSSFANEQVRYFYPDVLEALRQDPRYEGLLADVDRSWGLGTASGEARR